MPSSISYPCPKCGEYELHRSRSKHLFERWAKRLLKMRTYRCSTCNWRGWVKSKKIKGAPKNSIQTFLFYLFVVLIALVVAMLMKNMIN